MSARFRAIFADQYFGSYSSSHDLTITPFYTVMRPLSVLMTFALLTIGLPAQTPSGIEVVVLEGDGATNSLAGKSLHPVTIMVQDAAKRPVEGALVSLVLPATGAGGSFSYGNTIETKHTGREGRVTFSGMHSRNVAGSFRGDVRASSNGLRGSGEFTQTNAEIDGPPHSRWTNKRTLIMVGVIAAGAGIGLGVGLHNSGGGNPAGYTVTPGGPTVTAPR
ncbi:MAG: hypothetical protein ABJF23_24780 [Bryobacteraceae bacterium]